MSTLDVDALLPEIDPAAPCGPNLEGEQAFLALNLEAEGKPEVQYGATLTPAVPPDWKAVRRMAGELLARSRDLRLAVHLLRANLALSGIAGLAQGAALIERMLDTCWDSVYPMLDADDNDDPTERINSLAILCDTNTLLRELKDAPLVVLPGLGPLTIRLLDIANGELAPPAGQEKIELHSIERAIADLDPGQLAATVDALGRALEAVVNIEAILVRRVGSSRALNLDALTRPLRMALDFLTRQQPREPASGRLPQAAHETALAEAGRVRAAPAAVGGEVTSREDVLRTLDRLIQYYHRHEPSSPIPILLERAKRLIPMNFFELLEDLAPEGVAQLAVIRGPDGAKQNDD
jgi:type VI secretion system protein ImpA